MQPPKIPSFFKTKKPSQFHYEPRYYNERKEKMEERFSRISNEVNQRNERTNPDLFRSSLREQWGATQHRGNTSSVNKRVLIYIVLLVGLAYYFLK